VLAPLVRRPFVGLFGTSGASCRASSRSRLKEYLAGGGRPGIAEALFATAIGLSRHSATIFYNKVHFRGEPAGPAAGRFADNFQHPSARSTNGHKRRYIMHIGEHHSMAMNMQVRRGGGAAPRKPVMRR